MILFLSLFISLICILSPIAPIASSNTITVSNSVLYTASNNVIVDGFNNISFNSHKNYLGLDDSTHFALSNTTLYYSTNSAIYSYSFSSGITTKLVDVDNVENLSYSNNTLYVFKDSTLYTFSNSTLNVLTTCDMYSIYTAGSNTYLCTISGYNFVAYNITATDKVSLWDTTLNSTFNTIAITNSNTVAYIVANQTGNSRTKILEVNFQTKNTEVYSYDFDIDNVFYWDSNTDPVLVYYSEEDLRTIRKKSDTTEYEYVFSKPQYNHGDHGFEIGKVYKVKDCTIYNGHLYILDNIYSAIQKFEHTTDIKFVEVVTSSSAYTDGKFYNPKTFDAVNKDLLLVADTQNKAVQSITNFQAELIKNYTENTSKTYFEYVDRVLKSNTNYYILEHDALNNYNILVLDNSMNLVSRINHTLTEILDIALIGDDLYILDYTTTALYRYTNGNIENTTITGFDLTDNSKLHYIIETNTLAINSDTKAYFINLNDKTTTSYDNTREIFSITSDFKGNIYILDDTEISRLDNTYSKTTSITLDKSYTHMSLEKESGYIYLFNKPNQCFAILKTNKTYNLTNDYTHPISLSNYENSEIVNIATTNTNVFVYTYPYNSGTSINISNQNVYILDSVDNYWYVCYMYTSQNDYPTLQLGYISKGSASINTCKEEPLKQQYTVLCDTSIYSLPTMLKYNNSNLIVGELKANTFTSSNYELLSSALSIDGCEFYIISYSNKIGYVKKVDIISTKVNHTNELLKTNAELVVGEDRYNTIYVYAGTNSTYTDKLLVGKQIYVENYDINSKYTYIRYLDENNREKGGYVLTKCIKMDNNGGANVGAIILIVLTVLALGGVTTFYILSYRKQQKNIQENKK